MTLLRIRQLTVGPEDAAPLVQQVNLSVEKGETLAIVGESGSGKSLTMLSVPGLLPPGIRAQGSVTLNGQSLLDLPASQLRALRGSHIGYVSQDPLSNLHPLKSIGRQIEEAILAHHKVPRRALHARVLALLEEVGIRDAARRYHDRPARFSGGMRQRVMIAIAIALNPSLIIADEPTTALDATVQASILQLLKRLQQQHGCALVFISHDLRVVADIADRIAVMQQGKVVEQGPAQLLFRAPQHPYTRSLLQAGHIPLKTHDLAGAKPLLQVEDLARQFRQRRLFGRSGHIHTVLDGISFTLHAGEIVGLVGESGSGKTTLGRTLVGLDAPDRGQIGLNGATWLHAGGALPDWHHPQRHLVQMVFQDPYSSLNPRRRLSDTLAEPLQIRARQRDGKSLSATALANAVDQLLQTVELAPELRHRYPAQLSGGQRQRVAIARALALEPQIIVADEAVSALDITTQQRIVQLLLRLRAERGLAILFISHDLAAVAALCDRVMVLQDGRIIEQGLTAQVFTAPQQPWTQALLNALPGQHRERDYGAASA